MSVRIFKIPCIVNAPELAPSDISFYLFIFSSFNLHCTLYSTKQIPNITLQ